MATDIPEPRVDDDPRSAESALLAGLRSAIASGEGPLDQSAIDEALGVSRMATEDGITDNDAVG